MKFLAALLLGISSSGLAVPKAYSVAFGDPLPLKVSANGRYFTTADGKPFFWLGDTGWLLFVKLKKEQAVTYLDDRKQKGYNVIQVMVLHKIDEVNGYGDSALINRNVATPDTKPGKTAKGGKQYSYWDHVDYIVDAAAKRGMYIALVPVWGSVVKDGHVTADEAKVYAEFLANRYKSKSNIIWMNGGDIKGSDSMAVWKTIGETLREKDPNHLITFHPRGRFQSSTWFHNESWMDFNVFQSGHRTYDQDTSAGELHYGEDNWKYINDDYSKTPVKPTFDAEPSYENIPHGLHNPKDGLWTADDIRRYAYWSVFAGACGYTYGDNAVMQMHRFGDKDANYGVKQQWFDAIKDPGAAQMVHIKNLMLSKADYFDRVPDQSLIAGEVGEKYNRLIATRSKNYGFIYTYTGRTISAHLDKFTGCGICYIKASWFNPRDGKYTAIGNYPMKGVQDFNPPGEEKAGNDWVLVLEVASKK